MAHANLRHAAAAVMLLTVVPPAAHAAPEAIVIEIDKSKGAEPLKRPAAAMLRGVVRFRVIWVGPTLTVRVAPSVRNTTLAGTCSDRPSRLAA